MGVPLTQAVGLGFVISPLWGSTPRPRGAAPWGSKTWASFDHPFGAQTPGRVGPHLGAQKPGPRRAAPRGSKTWASFDHPFGAQPPGLIGPHLGAHNPRLRCALPDQVGLRHRKCRNPDHRPRRNRISWGDPFRGFHPRLMMFGPVGPADRHDFDVTPHRAVRGLIRLVGLVTCSVAGPFKFMPGRRASEGLPRSRIRRRMGLAPGARVEESQSHHAAGGKWQCGSG